MKEKFIDSKWHFTLIENSVIEDERLLPSEKLVYIVLSKFASRERCCFPSLSTIAKLSGYSKSTVVRAINRLCHLGYLRKERRKDEIRGNISTFYTLTLPEDTSLPNAPLPEEAPEESTPEEEEFLFDSTPCINDTSPCLMMTQALYHDDTTLVSPVDHNDIYYNDIHLTRDNKYITYVRRDAPEAKREIVTHLYHQLKDLGISKSPSWFGKQMKIAENLLSRYPPDVIFSVIDFAFQDCFWKTSFDGLEKMEKVLQKMKGEKNDRKLSDEEYYYGCEPRGCRILR
ncbi:MAG TPA: helix-turn-helix domain-containing protein [Candidatus Atribacteria bacterium]|nr:helix-turn-helix domain-containing protein [Candidatus Atribacteria bacterium]